MNLYGTLYRKRALQASLALLVITFTGMALAQTQKRKPHKLRATALLELTTDRVGNLKAQLTPITILTDGRFEDASIYKAAPEPMAIENGIVYEAQKTGIPVGYVTVTNSTKAGIWTALGKWQVVTTVAKKAEPAATPAGNPDDGRPHLKRPGESSNPTSSSTTSQPQTTSDSSGTPPANTTDERPRLHRPDENPSPQPSPAATPAAQETPQSAPEPAPEDSDRPVLRRRSPSTVTAAPTPDATRASTPVPGARPTPPPQGAVPSTVPKPPVSGTQTLVAVSDNESGETRPFTFVWKPGEQEAMEAKMRKLALAQLPKENAQLNDGSLKNVVIRSFDLDLSNDAVMVLTAEIPGSYLAPGGTTGSGKTGPRKAGSAKTATQNAGTQDATPGRFVSRYITLIARVDFDGVPQRLAVSVTDSSRLDVAPRLELIDAVDVDGDGLAELLFREYSFDQKGFIVYGIGRSTVTKVFEGASQDLK